MQGWGYTVFGKVVEGSDVLDKIRAVSTTTKGGHQDVPTDDVIIESVSIVEE
jgi:peptidyl-prolyl cis-trans isomerase B (cyclophilin B)